GTRRLTADARFGRLVPDARLRRIAPDAPASPDSPEFHQHALARPHRHTGRHDHLVAGERILGAALPAGESLVGCGDELRAARVGAEAEAQVNGAPAAADDALP